MEKQEHKIGWIKKEDETPEIGQLILVFWPASVHPVSKERHGAEIACFRYAESEEFGKWYPKFLWGSGRFGHSSTSFATHWMPIPSFPGEI